MTAASDRPEPKWVWRRLIVWVVSVFAMLQLHGILKRIPLEHIAQIADRLLVLLGLVLAVYLIGPTAEHIVALVRAWRGDRQ